MKSTKLTTVKDREIVLEHRFLNDDFCEDAKSYWIEKHNWSNRTELNTYFISKAVQEFIIDKDLDPVYEEEEYVRTNEKFPMELWSNMQKLMA